MLKGDIGLRSIFAIVLGLMALSLLISVSSVGSLGGALQQGFDEVETYTDRTAEIENKKTLSDLTLFVKHRAADQGCAKVATVNSGSWENDPRGDSLEGYPGLSEVEHLGAKPECFGGEAGIIRDPPLSLDQENPDENYMTGVFSREKFEVMNNETVFNSATGNTWLDSNIAGFYDTSLETVDENMEVKENGIGPIPGTFMVAGSILGSLGGAPGTAIGAVGGYAIGSITEDAFNNLAPTKTSEVVIIFQDNDVDLEDRVNAEDFESLPEDPSELEEGDIENLDKKVVFCEGDKGYVQSNRGTIANSDGASSQEPLYPVIVIEESKYSECENPDLGRSDKIPESIPDTGRLLHIGSRMTEDHPHIQKLGYYNQYQEYSFNLHNLNENTDILQTKLGEDIEFDYRSERSQQCIIGLYDGSIDGGASGWVSLERGTVLRKDGNFPSRSSDAVIEDRTQHRDSGLLRTLSTRDLYDRHVNQGFTGEDWKETGLTEAFVYNYQGDRHYEMYTDLICVPHSNNNAFEDDHSEWKACTDDGETVGVNGQEYKCDTQTGKWNYQGSNNPSCESDEYRCSNGKCVDDPSQCGGL